MRAEAKSPHPVKAPTIVGRYALYDEIASGGMATVHMGRLLGPVGFARTVAIKRLHPHLAKEPDFVAMLLDEARLVSRIQHPNVCSTLDVIETPTELLLVMEYLQGDTLSRLVRRAAQLGEKIPPAIAVSIVGGALRGLHAAHTARSETGSPLDIVHRDVSPQNIFVNRDGVTKVLDFGVARAAGRAQTTREGTLKGKLAYMTPEQLRGDLATPASDVYAAAVSLWEALTGERLFVGETDGAVAASVLLSDIRSPRAVVPSLPAELDAVVTRALARDTAQRFASARELAVALESAQRPALATEVGEWVERVAGRTLEAMAVRVADMESQSSANLLDLAHLTTDLSVEVELPADLATGPTPSAGRSWARKAGYVVVPLAIVGALVAAAHALRREPSLAPSTERRASAAPVPIISPTTSERSVPQPTESTVPNRTSPTSTARSWANAGKVPTGGRPLPIIASTATSISAVPATAQPAQNCNPPFRFDANGDRVYKRECL